MKRLLLALILTTTAAVAAESHKSQFHLFNPVPKEQMRELSPDRPDLTESPRTVDAGHFQIEMSFVEFSRNSSETLTFAATNLKLGLLHNVDMQVVFDAYVEEKAITRRASDFGDIQLRLKINIWGNDSGTTAFALLPFVQIPTGTGVSSGEVEGGLALPLSIELSDRLELGLMVEIDFVGSEAEFLHSAALGIALTQRLGAFIEYIGISRGKYQASVSGGFTFSLNDNVQLDAGARTALTDDGEDLVVFSGITARF